MTSIKYRAPIHSLDQVLDLREVEPARRLPRALMAFGGLAKGEGLVLVDAGWPAGLLDALQRRHWGQFDWYPLGVEPGLVRIALSRRAVPLSPLRQLLSFMTADHRRIELLLLQVRVLAGEGRWREASRLGGYLETGITRHIQLEEELLLPILIERTRSRVGAQVERIKEEHRQMLQELRLLQASAFDAQADLAPARAIEREIALMSASLMRSFFEHERNESKVLYTPVDLSMSPEETEALVKKLQAVQ
jgi:uncharacterized protein (DUF2249 family)